MLRQERGVHDLSLGPLGVSSAEWWQLGARTALCGTVLMGHLRCVLSRNSQPPLGALA